MTTGPDTITSAVLNHIDRNESPTDDEAFDGVPKTPVDDVPTAPMRIPHDTIPNPFVGDENGEEDGVTAVRRTTTRDELDMLQDSLSHEAWRNAFDPADCMM